MFYQLFKIILVFVSIFEVNNLLLPHYGIANSQICSFNDESTGFYSSWHSNCSGLVNFIVNMRNFPRTSNFPLIGFFDEPIFREQHFWIGIGFRLISTEMAIVENPSGSFVSVTPARFEPGRPPIREVGGGILINPRGTFIDSTIVANFAIDESFFGIGCIELLFFNALTPINAPYGGIPHSRTICDLTKTCSRFPCPEYGSIPSFGGISPPMDYLDNNLNQFIPPPQTYSPYFPQSTNYFQNYNNNPLNNYQNYPFSNQFDQKLRQQQQLSYLNKDLIFNNCPPTFNEQSLQFSSSLYPQYDNNPYFSRIPLSFAERVKRIKKRGKQKQIKSLENQKTTNPNILSLINLNNTLLSLKEHSFKFKRQIPSKPIVSPFNHQQNNNIKVSPLKGTAYEGQDNIYPRIENTIPAANPQYEALENWKNKQGKQQQNWHPIEQGGVNKSQMYWPWRTKIGQQDVMAGDFNENKEEKQQFEQFKGKDVGLPQTKKLNFFDPKKCDGGIDPYWCKDYIKQFMLGIEGGNKNNNNKFPCPARLESLKNSDHRCCNALQQLGC
uniref:Uncharacterized protein n=1 Tax=Meloidogyne enterolobii TaxID=390850 RepID=A0A6V7TS82_MELEN|nr:unnamed protein product [Meloidogyne enterolobii]